jgi:KDO2-lipid IV(A) lauroyltransferase
LKRSLLEKKKISFLRRVGFVLEASIVIPLGNLIALLPWKTGRFLAALMGVLIFRLSGKARKRAGRNLDIIYAEKSLSSAEKEGVIRRLFINLASSAFEYLKIGAITAENHTQFVRVENSRALDRAVDEGKGVLAISAHIGNWEILATIGAKLGKNIGAIIHRQLNPYTDKWLRQIREKKGKIKCFYDEVSNMRQVVGHLKGNGILAILADEIYPIKPIFVPFFGRPAATPDGPAKLHLLYGSPLVICFAVKQPDGKYLLTLDGPYHFEESGDLRKDCETIMTWITSKYEAVIRKYPDQWFSLLTPRWEQNRPEDFKNRSWR